MIYYWTLKTCRSLWPAENESCRSHMKSCRTVTDGYFMHWNASPSSLWFRWLGVLRKLNSAQYALSLLQGMPRCFLSHRILLLAVSSVEPGKASMPSRAQLAGRESPSMLEQTIEFSATGRVCCPLYTSTRLWNNIPVSCESTATRRRTSQPTGQV